MKLYIIPKTDADAVYNDAAALRTMNSRYPEAGGYVVRETGYVMIGGTVQHRLTGGDGQRDKTEEILKVILAAGGTIGFRYSWPEPWRQVSYSSLTFQTDEFGDYFSG